MNHVVLTMSDGSARVMTLATRGRSSRLPVGARWADEKNGYWTRTIGIAAIEDEIARTAFVEDLPALDPRNQDPNYVPKRVTVVSWREVTEAELPTILTADTAFHSARTDVGGVLRHDMAKARDIQRDRLRKERLPLLDELDREYMRAAVKAPGDLEIIEAERQALRDLPADPRIEAATTVDELKLVTASAAIAPR